MATRFEIQVSNGAVTITVDGQSGGTNAADGGNGKSSGTASGGNGKSSGTASGGNGKSSGTGSGGGEPGGDKAGSGGCCAPLVIGPIVISGGMIGSADGDAGGNGKSSGTASGGNGKSSGTASGGNGKSSGTASGGGEPGGDKAGSGGCCAPVVIGPIVISDCCAGAGVADSSGTDHSTAVSIDPPSGLTASTGELGAFKMEPQQETFWCWAAVAVSISRFLNPTNAALGWTQKTLATKLMQQLGNATADCSADPGGRACNQPEPLNIALSITENLLLPGGAMFDQHLTFESLQKWFTAQLPVAARIKWRGGGAHFIALDACKVTASGRQLVHVQDPNSTASSSPGFWDYDALVEEYQEAGFWNDTYLVKPALLS